MVDTEGPVTTRVPDWVRTRIGCPAWLTGTPQHRVDGRTVIVAEWHWRSAGSRSSRGLSETQSIRDNCGDFRGREPGDGWWGRQVSGGSLRYRAMAGLVLVRNR